MLRGRLGLEPGQQPPVACGRLDRLRALADLRPDFEAAVRLSPNCARAPFCTRFDNPCRVVLTGWGVGERHWGGLAQKARVKAEWLVLKPQGLSLQQTMVFPALGTFREAHPGLDVHLVTTDEVLADPTLLPLEYRILGVRPLTPERPRSTCDARPAGCYSDGLFRPCSTA